MGGYDILSSGGYGVCMGTRKLDAGRWPAAGAFYIFPYLTDVAYLPYSLISPELGNLVVLHRVACLRQPRELLLSPRAIGFSLSLGHGKHIAAQAPSLRALNLGVGAPVTLSTTSGTYLRPQLFDKW